MSHIVCSKDTITAMITPAMSTISTVGDRVSVLEEKIDELYQMLEELKLAIAPSTNAEIVEPKEKSDLEIFEPIDEIKVKNIFIDLDDIKNEKLWEPYDGDWWNK